MDMQYVLFSIRSTTKPLVVSVFVCLFAYTASAQLEFSNFIVGKNTIMHIELDGTTSLVTHNGITGDNYNHRYVHLLSSKDGIPKVKIGNKTWRHENGGVIGFGGVCELSHINDEPIFVNEPGINTPAPFMLKSPNGKFTYILHSTFTYEYEYDNEKDLINRIGTTQIRCFCKDNFNDADKGEDFIVHQFTHIESFKETLYGGGTMGTQDGNVEYPFFGGLSHTDNKSVWILTKCADVDSLIAIHLDGKNIIQKKVSHLHLNGSEFSDRAMSMQSSYNITDNGKIYTWVDGSLEKLCIYFNQDNGTIIDHSYYGLSTISQYTEISATGKYMYYTRMINNQTNERGLYRIKISDLEKEEYYSETIINGNAKPQTIRIGIDGNIYLKNGKSIAVVYDSESDNPRVETLYTETDIPDSDIEFPNYLYTYELFACNSDCDRNATFSFPDPRNEIIAYEWNFGDGSTSTDSSPTHKYSQTGIYTVSLKVTLKNGHIKTVPTRKISILDHKASATFNNAIVCHGEPLKISLTGNAPYQIFYTFNGEEQTITTSDTEFTLPQTPGKYTITKIKNAFCETKPNKDNTAEILPQLNKLNIIKK